jgi:hypothetical protein
VIECGVIKANMLSEFGETGDPGFQFPAKLTERLCYRCDHAVLTTGHRGPEPAGFPRQPAHNNRQGSFKTQVLRAPGWSSAPGRQSHFEMYLDAMKQCGANTIPVINFLENVKSTQLYQRFKSKFIS